MNITDRLEPLTSLCVDKYGIHLKKACKYYLRETLSEEDLQAIVRGSVWAALHDNPEMSDEEIVVVTRQYLNDMSEIFQIQREAKTRLAKRVSIQKWFPTETTSLPDDVVEAIAPKPRGKRHLEYETILATHTAEQWLAKLLEAGLDPNYALAIVLYYAYGFSIPKILELWGYTEQELGKDSFNALRFKTWRHLGDGPRFVRSIIDENEVKLILEHFGD